MKDKYLASFYWAAVSFSTVGYGDIGPTNIIEICVCIILLLVGVTTYSYIVSNLSRLVSNVGANSSIASKEALVNDFASKQRFSESLTKKISYFFKS